MQVNKQKAVHTTEHEEEEEEDRSAVIVWIIYNEEGCYQDSNVCACI